MALTPGAKVFLGAAAVGLGGYWLLNRRPDRVAATERNPHIVTRHDTSKYEEERAGKGSTSGTFSASYPQVGAGPGQRPSNITTDFPASRARIAPEAEYAERLRQMSASSTFDRFAHAAERSSSSLVGTTEDAVQRDALTEYVRGMLLAERADPARRQEAYTRGMPTQGAPAPPAPSTWDVVREHGKTIAADARKAGSDARTIAEAHGELAKRDVSQMGSELKEAFTGDTLRGKAIVRDAPDDIQGGGGDRTRELPTSSSSDPVARWAPSPVDRLKEGASILGAHTRAALDNAKKESSELVDTFREHKTQAVRDAKQMREQSDKPPQ